MRGHSPQPDDPGPVTGPVLPRDPDERESDLLDSTPDKTSSVNPDVHPGAHGPHHRLLRYFAYEHLPEPLQAISAPFGLLAHQLTDKPAEDPAELTVALRKLLEAKDAAVRAFVPPQEP